ncbi:MAG: urease accessory protein UreD [Chitinophagales bacterium]
MNSNVSIITKARNGITYLKDSFHSVPFKVVDVREDKSKACLEIMLMSSSPGMLDGDVYHLEIQVEKNCTLHLKTQSFQRIFNMKNSAQQVFKVVVEENGFFQYIPHPTVPHKNSNYLGINNIYLHKGANVIWSDLTSCGRKLNGEQFEYDRFENKTTFYINQKPMVIEHILFEPKSRSPLTFGQLEGFTHNASLFILSEQLPFPKLKKEVDDLLSQEKDIAFGSSEAAINGLIVKVLANQSERIYTVINQLADQIKRDYFNL